MFTSIDPFTGITATTINFDNHETLELKKQQALDAFHSWKFLPFSEKAQLFTRLSSLLTEQKKQIALCITQEMGKPIRQSIAEVEKCATSIDWYCEHGSAFLQDEIVTKLEHASAFIRREPLGVVLAIMPWNFPLWQVFRYAIPTLLAGNVSLLKHAPNVPRCAALIQELFLNAGFPQGVFQSVYLSVEDTATLIESAAVQAVTLTGSEGAGRSVAAIAGKSLKKCVLELGGSDPFIVLKDADIHSTIDGAITGRLQNNGQSCIASKRFIIEEPIYDLFLQKLKEALAKLQLADPTLDTTDLGPMARPDLKKLLQQQVYQSIEAGAAVYYKHPFNDTDSNFFAPLLLEHIPDNCPARKDELFGPVFSCFKAANEDEAIMIANETTFGLGASLWTSDLIRAEAIALKIESGSVFINGIVRSDARLPFGGIKHSGYGRELSMHGMHEFVNVKTYWKKV